MGGEINPRLNGDVRGRARENAFTPEGKRKFQQRDQGELESANSIEPDIDWAVCKVNGTTTITQIVPTAAAHIIVFRFGANCTVKAGGNLKLAGDFNGGNESTLTLVCNGTNWYEIGRNPILSGEVATAETITPPSTANVVKVEGEGTVKKVTATYAGHVLTLRFGAATKVVDGENLRLAGDFEATADDTLTLACNGTNWFEVARSAN